MRYQKRKGEDEKGRKGPTAEGKRNDGNGGYSFQKKDVRDLRGQGKRGML